MLTLQLLSTLALGAAPVVPILVSPQDGGGDDAAQQDADPSPADAEPDGPPPFLSPFEWDPEIQRGLQLRTGDAADGYTLIQPLNSREAVLIDLAGDVVHRWEFALSPGNWMYLQDDGSVLAALREDDEPAFRGGGIGGRIQHVAADGSLLWDYRLADDTTCQHHDIEPLPNGNLLVIAWERIPSEEAIAHGRDPAWVGEAGLWSDMVLELRPLPPNDAEVVWRWRAWDHLVQDFDPAAKGYGDVIDNPGRIDVNVDVRAKPPLSREERERRADQLRRLEALGYTGGMSSNSITIQPDDDEAAEERRKMLARSGDMLHTNGIDYLASEQLIVLSSPEMNELIVIDHATTIEEATSGSGGRRGRGGDLLWRWGNPKNYGAGEDDDQRLHYQHDPRWMVDADGGLRLLVFNNGGGRGSDGEGWSSVEELALPFDTDRGFTRAAGAAFGPSEPAWSYADPERFFSAFISGAQRLWNGNTLICSGAGGRVFEVTREGEVVWDYRNPFGGDVKPPDHAGKAPPLALFRADRYPPDHPGIVRLLAD